MPLYQWVCIRRDTYETEYAVWLIERHRLVRRVNKVWLDGYRSQSFISRSSTDPDGSSDDESD